MEVVEVGSGAGAAVTDFGVVAEGEVVDVTVPSRWDGGDVAETLNATNAVRAARAAMAATPSIVRDGRLPLSVAACLAMANSFAAVAG